MHHNLPFPIAFSYDLIDSAREASERLERVYQCHEVVLRYLATVQLSDYLANGCPNPDLNKFLLERIGINFSLGHWARIVREVCLLQLSGAFPAFMPELPAFFYATNKAKRKRTPAAEVLEETLINARNNRAHGKEQPTKEELAQMYTDHRALLDGLLRELQFLSMYTLYVPTNAKRSDLVTEALILMGPKERPTFRSDLNIPLSSRVQAHLECELTAFLCAPDDIGHQLLLAPLSLFANTNGSEDIYLFEHCQQQNSILKQLQYRAIRIGQKALHVSSGSSYQRLITQFREMLDALGSAASPPVAETPSVAGHYFEAQTKIIQERLAGFVGRENVEAAINQFLERNPRGYFFLRAGPGQGKTAVACRCIQQHAAAHHLINVTGGRDNPHLILGSIIAQLDPTMAADQMPETLQERAKRFEELLSRRRHSEKPTLIVIDGLDELTTEVSQLPPFLPTDSLPSGVFFLVTSWPCERLDRVRNATSTFPNEVLELGALQLKDVADILAHHGLALRPTEVERIAQACQGNPLYLHAVAAELSREGGFNLNELPSSIEGFFRKATEPLRQANNGLGRDILGLLTVARKPLSALELSRITGRRLREIHELGLAPVRQFLHTSDDSFSFYHARFRDFILREFLYSDELPDYHRLLAEWLSRPESREINYRWESLVYHLHEAGEFQRLLNLVDHNYLEEKLRRNGYGVLEDIDCFAKTMLRDAVPEALERCIALVEGLRTAAGGDIISGAVLTPQVFQPGPGGFRTRVIEPAIPQIPNVDLYIALLPKIEVAADFVEIIPNAEGVVIVLGDAPSAGLKAAFMARFLGNLFRNSIGAGSQTSASLASAVARVNRTIAGSEFFDAIAVQVAEISPAARRIRLVNAGYPFAALFSAKRGKTDLLPVYGDLLHGPTAEFVPPRWEQRTTEVALGDVFVMMSDGLTESWRPGADAYREKYMNHLAPGRSAREIGNAILDDWRQHPRDRDYSDDVTLVVAVFTQKS